jgi:glutathione peroxidase
MFTAIFALLTCKSISQDNPVTPPVSFYQLEFTSITGQPVQFETLKGKKVLIVNTASKCGFTPQFKDLEALAERYKDNLVVIGFPSNDFGGQDPGSNQEIQEFCQLNYGVTFLMMSKSIVKGNEKNPVFQWLTTKTENGWNEAEPSWNFCKYLIDETGRLVGFYPSKVNPLSDEIVKRIDL